jgi:hypothetical protein
VFEDLRPPGREGVDCPAWDAFDRRDTVRYGSELDPECPCELVTKDGLVDVAGGLGVGVEVAGVERGPAPVIAFDHIRNKHMVVKVRVVVTVAVVTERRGDEPSSVDRLDPVVSSPRVNGGLFEVPDRRRHPSTMRGFDRSRDLGTAEGVEK